MLRRPEAGGLRAQGGVKAPRWVWPARSGIKTRRLVCWADGLTSPGEGAGIASAAGALKDPCTLPLCSRSSPSPLPVPKPQPCFS